MLADVLLKGGKRDKQIRIDVTKILDLFMQAIIF
jgi:hypothetical protein